MKSNIDSCPPPDVIIFDLCGTLQDSKPTDRLVRDAVCTQFLGGPYDQFKHLKNPNLSMHGNFMVLFGDQFPEAYAEYVRLLIENIPNTPLFPGVAEFLTFASTQDTKLVVLTNRPAEYADAAVDHHNIRPFFDAVISAPDEFGFEKPDSRLIAACLEHIGAPPDSRVALVGDSRVDVVCAREANCIPIVFTGRLSDGEPGFLHRQSREGHSNRTYTFSDYRQLVKLWGEKGNTRSAVTFREVGTPRRAIDSRKFGAFRLREAAPV